MAAGGVRSETREIRTKNKRDVNARVSFNVVTFFVRRADGPFFFFRTTTTLPPYWSAAYERNRDAVNTLLNRGTRRFEHIILRNVTIRISGPLVHRDQRSTVIRERRRYNDIYGMVAWNIRRNAGEGRLRNGRIHRTTRALYSIFEYACVYYRSSDKISKRIRARVRFVPS